MNLKKIILLGICAFANCTCSGQSKNNAMQRISANNMHVQWTYSGERIYFKMDAPTEGWITIGFNLGSSMTGAYLIMGNVTDGAVNVVEHYTKSPGNYRPILQLKGGSIEVSDVKGKEIEKHTEISFSLPIATENKYQRALNKGMEYSMILAYSREDDFQHHSMMRTSKKVKL